MNTGQVDVAMDVHVGIFHNLLDKFFRLTIVPSIREDKQSNIWPDLELADKAAFGEGMNALMTFLKGQNLVNTHPPAAALEVLVQQRQRLIRDQGSWRSCSGAPAHPHLGTTVDWRRVCIAVLRGGLLASASHNLLHPQGGIRAHQGNRATNCMWQSSWRWCWLIVRRVTAVGSRKTC